MRMSGWLIRGLLVVVVGLLVWAGVSAGAAMASTPQLAAHPVATYQGPPGRGFITPLIHAATPPTSTTAPTDVNQQQKAADSALARRKVILAVVSVGLLAIVYFGHKARNKAKAKS
jgi:hypothetical protein